METGCLWAAYDIVRTGPMISAFEKIASAPRTLIVLVAALSLACSAPASPPPEETPPPMPTQVPQSATVSPTAETPLTAPPTPTSTGESPGYDPTDTMFQLFSGIDHSTADSLQALQLVRDEKDISQVRVIVEIMRFWSPLLDNAAADTLAELTGQDFREEVNEWGSWMEWLGKRPDEYRPPAGYLKWKINLLSIISHRYEDFLASAEETARIDLTELVWGGVRPDGIPDLRSAPVIPAAEADYLNDDDRVFGVSINGKHRAYPLRIVNPHEMANDVLGGEPIALAY